MEDRLPDIMSHVAAKYGMKNWRYKREESSKIIETYLCVLIPLTVIEVLEDKEIFRHVYLKLPNGNKTLRDCTGYLWDAEIYIYSHFVPVWKRLSKINIDELIPRCYYADATRNNQTLVLKNMKREGFQNHKDTFLDFEHVVLSLKSLAQFHALSFIIKKDYENQMASIFRPYTHEYPHELQVAITNSFRAHFQLFKGTKYENYWKECLTNYKAIADCTSKAKCLLYGHGDYWKENILYKYEDNNPVKACILDFQTCQLMSPAYDFLYFILNSTNGSLRRLHYHSFVAEYYETFKNTLFDHGIQLELFYMKEDFFSDLNIVASMCFIRICLAFSLWLGFESNALIKSKNVLDDKEQTDKEVGYFKDILVDAMEDLCNYGYISL